MCGFPFGGGASGCEIESPSEGLLSSSPLGVGNLLSLDSKESQPGVNDCDADGTPGCWGVRVWVVLAIVKENGDLVPYWHLRRVEVPHLNSHSEELGCLL